MDGGHSFGWLVGLWLWYAVVCCDDIYIYQATQAVAMALGGICRLRASWTIRLDGGGVGTYVGGVGNGIVREREEAGMKWGVRWMGWIDGGILAS